MCEVSRFLLWKIRHSLTEQLVLRWVSIKKKKNLSLKHLNQPRFMDNTDGQQGSSSGDPYSSSGQDSMA